MKEKILITVKTYPTLSKKYAELVCTAGVNEAGQWRRIYPVRFRLLNDESKYKKYQWIEADLKKSTSDQRPETYRLDNPDGVVPLDAPLPTSDNWQRRREDFVDKVDIHVDLGELIKGAHENKLSLSLFRPKQWIDLKVEEVGRKWDPKKLAILEQEKRQGNLFKDPETVAREFEVVKKLPYKFSYVFQDTHGKQSKLMIEDWEIGALYWKCLRRSKNDEKQAIKKVRHKYWDVFIQHEQADTLLVLGTTLEHHNKNAPNPFVVVSVVPLRREIQRRLF